MAWKSLKERMTENPEYLPLVLAGPILRKVTKDSVTVWLVLSKPTTVTLNIYSKQTVMLSAKSYALSLGQHVEVHCVTARAMNNSSSLKSGENYHYDIAFEGYPSLSQQGLNLSYEKDLRPSFALPPNDLEDLRIIHGSCRKPHAKGRDGLEALDVMLKESIEATKRPHHLFLSGDQIYADDVADALLYMIRDAAPVLFGWKESELEGIEYGVGKREQNNAALGLTSSASKSHAYSFQEYALLYILVWSDKLWPSVNDLPIYGEVHSKKNEDGTLNEPFYSGRKQGNSDNVIWPNVEWTSTFEGEVENLKTFRQTLAPIRKALANVPTYMMFDDHDVTDDWNLNWKWCKDFYSKSVSRKILSNALSTYVLFQAMGNDPERFEAGSELLQLILTKNKTATQETKLDSYLNIPTIAKNTSKIIDFPLHPNAVRWDFSLPFDHHEILVLDTRTMREFPNKDDRAICALMSKKGFELQMPKKESIEKEVVFVISPAPVLDAKMVIDIRKVLSSIGDKGRQKYDPEGWEFTKAAMHRLYARLASAIKGEGRFVFLSGDVHYGFAARHELWSKRLFESTPHTLADKNAFGKTCFAQFTSSPLKNEDGLTTSLHNIGYDTPMRSLAYGWNGDEHKKMRLGKTSIYPQGPKEYYRKGSPIVLSQNRMVVDRVTDLIDPDWIQKTTYLLGTNGDMSLHKLEERIPVPTAFDEVLEDEDRVGALAVYSAIKTQYWRYATKWGNGKEIVGVNNVAEIRLKKSEDQSHWIAQQKIWWRLRKLDDLFTIAPLTTYEVPLTTDTENPPKLL